MIDGFITLLAFLGFLGVTYWAYARSNRERFARAARLPLLDDERPHPEDHA